MPLGHPGTPRSTGAPRPDQPADPPVRSTLETLFLESTVLWASATALLGEEGRLSYADLMVRAQNVAAVLRSRGMRQGDLVGVVGRRTFGSIAAIVGILLAGGVYVPFDVHALAPDRLSRQLDQSEIQLLLVDRTDAAAASLPWARRVSLLDVSKVEREFMPLFQQVRLPARVPEDPAAVLFNKDGRGVLIMHHGIVRLVTTGALLEFSPSDTVLLHAGAQEHVFQLELWGALLAGGTVALAPHSLDTPQDSAPAFEYARVMRRYRVSMLCAQPNLLADLADEPLAPLAQVQQAVFESAGQSAGWMEPALLDRVRGREPAMRLTGGLGAPETTSFAVTVKVNLRDSGRPTPVAGSDALVLTSDLSEAEPGALGALAITGDSLAIGYLGQPESTLAAFPEARRSGGQRARCFRLPVQATKLADGRLLTGEAAVAAAQESERARHSRAREIEALLLAHPLVRECVALSSPEGDRVRCVFATLRAGEDPRAERTLREHLESRVAPEAQPGALVLLPRMPVDAAGKPDRARLSEQCEALLRRYTSPPSSSTPATPPARYAEVVRSIWQRLLHRMQVDLDEDFFSSGGTSIQRIRLQAELNQRFPGAFTSAELRQLNTIRKILDHLSTETARQRMQALERRGA